MATEELAATEVAGPAEAAGIPQLDFSTFPNQIFWLLVALGAIYLIVTRVAVPRIGGVLAERRGTIGNDLAAAEELKLKAVAAEQAYNKALADARAEAAKIVAAAKAEIQADLDAASARAETELSAKATESAARVAAIRDSAMESVGEIARDTAAEIVAAFGGSADPAMLADAVTRQMKGDAA